MVSSERPVAVPRIKTERLVLRGLTEADIPFVFEHFSKSEINEYSSAENLSSIEEARQLYVKYIAPRPQLFRLGMVLDETGKLVGTLGFYGIDHGNATAVVGVDLMKKCWGRGLMGEALDALVDYGFREMRLNRIEATVDPENVRCLRLMDRCGFRREGVLREKYYYKSKFHDDIILSILKSEWIMERRR